MITCLHTSCRIAVAGLAAAALLAACGDDDPSADLDIEAVDFAFEDLPHEVAPGTHLHLRNTSSEEVHEAAVFRVADADVDTPLPELLAAAETDPMALGEFVGVSVAPPGEEGVEPEGPVVLEEPGRYVIVCFVPTGADPGAYRDALETGIPPDVTGGLPHLAHGMVGELTVG
jgi:hypothetical protein